MIDDLVTQAIAELADLVRCRCHPAYRDRKLHDPDCHCDTQYAVQVVTDRIEEFEAQVSQADDVLNVANVFCKELEAKLEAMTLQHAAALEAVEKAREPALREAADVAKNRYKRWTFDSGVECDVSACLEIAHAILALINKGDSRE